MAKSMEKPDIVILEWPISLYEEKKRRWIYGSLAIKAEEVTFSPSDTVEGKKLTSIPFVDFIDVKKATTGLVFGAIYIVKKNNDKIWLSSLADRDGVYGTLRHFWRSQLTGENDPKKKLSNQKSQMGQKLLSIVKDSEETLSKAAVQLHGQGGQIDNAIGVMADLHNDLDVAENLVEDLQKWVGRWRMPTRYEAIDPVFVNKSEIPEVFEYEVLYTKIETGKMNNKNLGTLRISQDGVTILTLKMKTEHHYRWTDVSQLRVVTPWEMMVVRFQIGKPDLTYSVVSATMVAILKVLDKCARYKLKYDRPPDTVLCSNHKPAAQSRETGLLSNRQVSRFSEDETDIPISSAPSDIQIQTNQSAKTVTNKEADEISRALSGLKTLALSVQEEQSIQVEKLDSLTATVGSANQRLVTAEKKVKKMI